MLPVWNTHKYDGGVKAVHARKERFDYEEDYL